MTKIKICGLRRAQDADYANALLPDYIGFVLTPGFRRSITAETAEKLKKRLSGRIRAVGVFVNDSAARINALYENGIIDLAQLHGSENPAFCAEIKVPVIKYFNCAAGALMIRMPMIQRSICLIPARERAENSIGIIFRKPIGRFFWQADCPHRM